MISSAVSLSNPFVYQEEVTTSSFTVLSATDNMENGSVESVVSLGGASDLSLVVHVFEGEDYDIDWTQETLETAIAAKLSGKKISEL